MEQRGAPHIAGLHGGLTEQTPLLRSPKQTTGISNMLTSTVHGGLVDRSPLALIYRAPIGDIDIYASSHVFQTSDDQKWALIRKAGNSAQYRIVNLLTGAATDVPTTPQISSYLSQGSAKDIQFHTAGDTVFAVNPAVTVTCDTSPTPDITTAYLFVRKVSAALQDFTISTLFGGSRVVRIDKDNTETRESVAQKLAISINSEVDRPVVWMGQVVSPGKVQGTPGPMEVTATVLGVAPYIVKLTGSADAIRGLTARNNWDDTALTFIKGRVQSVNDLPPVFEANVPILVDLGRGDFKNQYYVRYDRERNGWIECSYVDSAGTTATLRAETMPVRLRQQTPTTFAWEATEWDARKVGDDRSNPLPGFVGRKISNVSTWGGRLLLCYDDTIRASQPDAYLNFWKETAREARPGDSFELQANGPDVVRITHLITSRAKLFAATNSVQLELGGSTFTEADARLAPVSKYRLAPECKPTVIGDSLFFMGRDLRGNVLWDYGYSFQGDTNTAVNTNEHCPSLIAGMPSQIAGSAAMSRMYLAGGSLANAVLCYDYHKQGVQLDHMAWSKLNMPPSTYVLNIAEFDGVLYYLLQTPDSVVIASCAGSPDYKLTPEVSTVRADFTVRVQGVYDAPTQRTVFAIPDHLKHTDFRPAMIVMVNKGGKWWDENVPVSLGDSVAIAGDQTGYPCYLGLRIKRSFTLGPFYPTDGQAPSAVGHLKVHKLLVDLAVTGDFTAKVYDSKRGLISTTEWTPRVVGESPATPVISTAVVGDIAVNSRGDRVTVEIVSESTVPLCAIGYAPAARYINTFQG